LVSFDTTNSNIGGHWPSNGGSAYLGFYFTVSSAIDAGWANISTTATGTASSFTVTDYAYETVGNASITAGQLTETPEPSTMALIALGGAGLIALRRRRAANA
jgi:hypothetical protein